MNITRQIGALTLANVAYLLSQLAVLIALTRLTDLVTVAQFGFVMAIVQPLYMLGLLGLRTAQATDADYEFGFGTYLGLRSVTLLVFLAAALGSILVLRPLYASLALPIILAKAVEMLCDLCYGAMQRDGKVQLVARSLLLRGPLSALIFAALLGAGSTAPMAFFAQLLVWTLVFLGHDLPKTTASVGRVAPQIDQGVIDLARRALPLGAGHFMAALQISLPRLFVEAMLGSAALALMTVVGYLQQAALTLFDALDQSVSWRLARYWLSAQAAAFWGLLRRMLLVGAAMGAWGVLLAMVFGAALLTLIFGPTYGQGGALLAWISVAIALRIICAILQTALYAQRRFGSFGWIQFWVLVATPPALWIGITFAGLEGAGAAIALLAGLRLVVLAVYVRAAR